MTKRKITIVMVMNDHLKTSAAGLEIIAKWEGCVLKPYKDIAGLRTIGFGHLIKPGENFPDGVIITRERALEILAKDVEICEKAIKRHIKVPLNQNQFDALVSFGFNCGVGVYINSGVAIAVNSGQFDKVPEKLQEWSKARVNGTMQVVIGLLNRRKHESEVFMRPVDVAPMCDPVVAWTKESLIETQINLKKLGLYGLKVDGIWGPGTSTAIEAFARDAEVPLANPQSGVPASLLQLLRDKTANC